jgi:ribosomal protein S19
MSRSLKKVFVLDYNLLKDISLKKYKVLEDVQEKITVKMKKRLDGRIFFVLKTKDIKIAPYMVGLNFLIYSGKNYFFLTVKESMLNYKFGEFVTTKILGSEIHLDKKKRKSKEK